MEPEAPIGIFDSGLGGLSVLKEVRSLLPRERYVYFADSAHCPYGGRSSLFILARCTEIASELLGRGAKILVVACNTATSVALADLRKMFDVPIVGLVPAVKPAVALSRTNRVAVLATPRTVEGESLHELICRFARDTQVYTVPAPGLAELVESGVVGGPRAEEALLPLLSPLVTAGVDVIVLGCTHYPFLRETIQDLVGPEVRLIDSGAAIARRVRAVLSDRGLLSRADSGGLEIVTSGGAAAAEMASRLLGEPVRATAVG